MKPLQHRRTTSQSIGTRQNRCRTGENAKARLTGAIQRRQVGKIGATIRDVGAAGTFAANGTEESLPLSLTMGEYNGPHSDRN